MERKGFIRPIQGGGSGEGLHIPFQVFTFEQEVFHETCRSIVHRARHAKSRLTDPVQSARMDVWMKALQRRMFELKPAVDTLDSDSSLRTSALGSRIINEPKNGMPENAAHTPSQGPTEERQLVPDIAKASISASLIQFIPGLPKNINTVVLYWRKGCPVTGNIPLFKFKEPKFRRMHVPYYPDVKWRASGQRSCFQRMSRLVSEVAKPYNLDIYAVGCDSEWEIATNSFLEKWGAMRLSTTLRRIAASRTPIPSSSQE